MADKHDGSIRIDTSLDNSGFEKGSRELIAAINSLTKEIQKLDQMLSGGSINIGAAAEQSASQVDGLTGKVEQAVKAANDLDSALDSVGDSDSIQDNVAGRLGAFELGVRDLSEELKNLDALRDKAFSGDPDALKELQENLALAGNSVDYLRLELEALAEAMDGATVENYQKALDSYGDTVSMIGESVSNAQLGDGAGLGGEAEAATDMASSLGEVLASAKELFPVLEKAEGAAAKAGAAMELLANPEVALAVAAITAAVGAIMKTIKAAKEKWQDFTEEFKAGKQAYKDLPRPFDETKKHLGFLHEAIKHPLQSLEKLQYAADQVGKKMLAAIGSRVLAKFKDLGIAAKDSARNLASMARQRVVSGIKNVASSAASLAKNLASAAAGRIKSGIQNLIGSIKALGKSAITSGFGMKQLLSATLGISGVSSLITKAIDATKDSMGGLAQKNKQFNATMSSFLTALNQLKGALAAAFAPIANVVVPLLTQLIGYVTQAATAVGMLSAALTGQKTFTKAVAVQADYASAADKSSKKTKKQAKETEKLKRQLMSFDDLNILHRDDKDDDNDDTGGFDPSAWGFDFEEVPIDSNIADLAERVKEAWEKADFYDLGRDLGERIKEGLESIPWAKIQKLASKAGKSLATFLNGLQETPGLAKAAGEALGEFVNTMFHFLDGFGANYNWSTLGQFIREGILGALNTVDWPLIYKVAKEYGAGIGRAIEAAFDDQQLWTAIFTALANGLNGIVYFIVAFLEAIDWGSMFENIALGLNAGIAAIDWAALARMFVDGFNGLFNAAYMFVTTFDFAKFGQHIGETLNTVIEQVDWTRAFMAMGAFVTGLFQSLLSFLQEVDWLQVGTTIAESINAAVGSTDWSLIGETLKTLFNSLIDAFLGFVKDFDFTEFGTSFGELINSAISGIQAEEFFEAIALLINGLFQALLNFLRENDWAQMAIDIANGMNAGIRAVDVEVISDSVSELINSLIDLFINFVTTFDWLQFGMTIGQSIGDALEKTNWEDFAHGLSSFINGLLVSLKGFVAAIDWTQLVLDIVDFMLEFFATIDWAEFGSTINLFITSLFNALDELMQTPQWDMIVDTITDAFDTFFREFDWADLVSRGIGLFIKAWNVYTDAKHEVWGVIIDVGKQVIAGLFKGIVDNLSDVGTWIKNNIFDKLVSGLCSVFGIHSPAKEMQPLGENISAGMLEGVKTPFSAIGSWLSEHVKNPFINKLRSIFGTKNSSSAMAKEGKELTDDFKDGADKGWKNIDSLFKTKSKGLVTIMKQVNWKSTGAHVTNDIKSGINFSGIESAMRNGASQAQNAFQNAVNWNNVGYYVASGIANGLSNNSGIISTAAWNAAVDAYNASCQALGIASPSKKFIWIAEMMMTGLRNGLVDNSKLAVHTIADIARNIVDTAENESPLMDLQIESSIDSLDSVLTSFSDKVVNSFAEMMARLEAVTRGSDFFFPAVAQGTLAPYAIGTSFSANKAMETSNSDVVDAISHLESSMLRQEELRPLLEDIARRYQPNFFMGDEQVARHANAGNELLAQRYNNR